MALLLISLNRLWDVLSPLMDTWRDLMSVLEAGTPYAAWCLGCGLGLGLLMLAGLVIFAPFQERDGP